MVWLQRRWREVVATVAAVVVVFASLAELPGRPGEAFRHTFGLPDPYDRGGSVSGDGTFAFEATQLGSHAPVGFDPCRTIHYVINPQGGPSDYLDFIQAAVAEASRVSGIDFAYDGTTDDRDFHRTSGPVLIGFAEEADVPQIGGDDVIGVGGGVMVQEGGHREYRSGMVALRTSWFAARDAEGRQDAEQAVVMHELGHVLGLDHVQDRNELMYPSITRLTYGPGDIKGLRALGHISCGGS